MHDNTGLKGIYDFKIIYDPIDLAAHPPGQLPEASSLFTAIETLGLKLKARKEPTKTVIVDQVDTPAAN